MTSNDHGRKAFSSVIKYIRKLVDGKHPIMGQQTSSSLNNEATKNCFHDKNGVAQCRIFRNFINLSSICHSTTFMSPKADEHVLAQICTLHGAKEFKF